MKKAACLLIVDPHNGLLRVTNRRNSTKVGLPGGKADEGETPFQTAVRETYEETWLHYGSETPIMEYVGVDGEYEVHTFLLFDWVKIDRCIGEEGIESWMTTWEELISNSDFPEYNRKLKEAYDQLLK